VKPLFAGLLLVATLTGCVSKSKSRGVAERAFLEGQRQALIEQQERRQPVVWVRGDVRNPRVAWSEGMTLAQAILAAQYTGNWDPRFISVTRSGEVQLVNTRRLLRGQDDPLLEPGDIVEVRR
jgi:hypothetical protein